MARFPAREFALSADVLLLVLVASKESNLSNFALHFKMFLLVRNENGGHGGGGGGGYRHNQSSAPPPSIAPPLSGPPPLGPRPPMQVYYYLQTKAKYNEGRG